MAHSIPTQAALQELAEKELKELETLNMVCGEAEAHARRTEQLQQFQDTWQPHLSNKEYTALYRNYLNLSSTVVKNRLEPGSAVAREPLTADSIEDGAEIVPPMSPAQWKAHLAEIEQMAKGFAQEIIDLSRADGDTNKRIEEVQVEARDFSMGRGLTIAQAGEAGRHFSESFLGALQTLTIAVQRRAEDLAESNVKDMVEANWKAFLTFAAQGSGELAKQCLVRFDERNEEASRKMTPEVAADYLARIERQRALIFDEYTENPDGLKRRLGVTAAQSSSKPWATEVQDQPVHYSSGQNLGDLAVRTAVRATVWEGVRSIFRAFR